MPELPEVQTTVDGINSYVKNLTIKDVWTDFNSKDPRFKDSIKNPAYFSHFKKEVAGTKILNASRRAKNILVYLSNKQTILIHMKMTGHVMYGTYVYEAKTNAWKAKDKGPLQDPFNRFVHLVFSLSNGKHLVLCDVRKFAKVALIQTNTLETTEHLNPLGPEPLDKTFTSHKLKERLLLRLNGKIKQVLMDPKIIAGVGNIYSDEALWLSGIHPERAPKSLKDNEIKTLFKALHTVLEKGIDFGGDSTSDYRNILGAPGKFHGTHNAYQKTNTPCGKRGCKGIIVRKMIGGRSAHFCNVHQK